VAGLIVLAAALMILLSAVSGPRDPDTAGGAGTRDLSVTWGSETGGLRVAGGGFRANSEVSIRVGTAEPILGRADASGAVTIEVPLRPSDVGSAGTSVIVSGRARSGAARTLVAASPPLAAGHGPVDLIPWSIGLVLAALVLLAALGRKSAKAGPRHGSTDILEGHEPNQT
jgi:hypothetical protein